jgi:hypothetical protein
MPILFAYSFAYAFIAYQCSRGLDGELKLFFTLFAIIFICYSVALAGLKARAFTAPFAHFLLAFIAGAVAMSIDAQLDEMAGMLYLMMPATLALGFLITCVQIAIQKARWKPDEVR